MEFIMGTGNYPILKFLSYKKYFSSEVVSKVKQNGVQ